MPPSLQPNLKNSCRLCLCPDPNLDIFSVCKSDMQYAQIVEFLLDFQIQPHASISDRICISCASNLILFQKFRMKCEDVNGRFMEFVDQMSPAKNKQQDNNETITICDNDETDSASEAEQSPSPSPTESQTNGDELVIELVKEAAAAPNDNGEDILEYFEEYLMDDDVADDEEAAEITVENQPMEEEYYEDRLDTLQTDRQQQHPAIQIIEHASTIISTAHSDSSSLLVISGPPTPRCDFRCELCGRAFGRKYTLEQHRQTHTHDKPYACELCGDRFTRLGHCNDHLRIHMNLRPYACEDCGRTFTKSGDLQRHRLVHSDTRSHACSQCAKCFKRHADLLVHERSHTGRRPYACRWPECTKAYTSHSSLKKHRLQCHPLVAEEEIVDEE